MIDLPQAERELLAGAERRLGGILLLLIAGGTAAVAWQWGGRMAGAFAFGGGLAYLNYRWIVAIVDALMRAQQGRIPRRTYAKLLLPLVLLGLLLYGIVARSLLSFPGVLGGLLLLVAAIVVEAVYELILAVRR